MAKPPYRPPMTVIRDETLVMSEMLSIEHQRYGTEFHIPVTPLYQQIQATIMMGHVLNLITSAGSYSESNKQDFQSLDKELQDVMKALLEPKAGHFLASCEALSMYRVSVRHPSTPRVN